MKLAEALYLRADLQKRIARLEERLVRNAKVPEGDFPAEEPKILLQELDESMEALETLIAQINLTNSRTMLEGKTLTECIAHKDALTLKLSVLRRFLQEASEKVQRYSKTEILIQSTVDVPKLQKEVDLLEKELRLLDVAIQGCNWNVDLME